MPKFAANLSLLYPELPFLDRFQAAARDGFQGVECLFPYAWPVQDMVNKQLSDMMVAAEFHAMPRRWVVGMTAQDFTDEQGRPQSEWSRIAGRVWASGQLPSEVEVGQFEESDLANFHNTINALASLVSSVAALAPDFMGLKTDNPASAEARRAGLERLIKRAERRQRSFGGSWERVMRIASRVVDGTDDAALSRLESIWRDAANPTVGQAADAAVKLHAEGIVPTRQTREDLGYTQEQITLMEAEDAKSVDRILSGDLSSLVGPKPVPTPPAG